MYKFINEHQIEEFKGDFIVVNNYVYTTPNDELILAAGYKPLVYTEQPEYDEEKQYLESYYFDGDGAIEVRYTVTDYPEIEDEEFIDEPIEDEVVEEEPQEEVVEEEVPSEE